MWNNPADTTIGSFRLHAMLSALRHWRDRRIIRRHPVDPSGWKDALAEIPILQPLTAEESSRLKDLAALFLQRKIFVTVHGLELSQRQRLLIAAQACYPILNLDFSWYDGWRTVIVYPGEFLRPRREMDASGIMHEWTEVLRGEAWERGPVVLSWADVAGSGYGDGYNVIIHELAHQLDMRNGPADGFPPLPRPMRASDWTHGFTDAYQRLNTLIDSGGDPPIDPYAAESPAEFFAVSSEYFFERPDVIRRHYPEVYRLLTQFYRQDPAARELLTGA